MKELADLRVAIVVDYLNQYGGAERVLEAILAIFPQADIFTSIYDHRRFPSQSRIRRSTVKTSLPNPGHLTNLLAKYLTFLYPFVFESFDLSRYDLVISSGTIWAKGVKTRPDQLHVFYCHTPPRFLYGYPSETSRRQSWYYRPLMIVLDHCLRIWDFNTAQKPNFILTNSQNVRRRIQKFYRRPATVIYPPVTLAKIESQEENVQRRDYFLVVSRLSTYKNIDLAIEACNRLKLPLKIAGVGKEAARLKRLAGGTVEFLGFVEENELAQLYRGCRAFLYTTLDEDFGLTPLEANAHGKPVIALRSGGVVETMIENQTALFFGEPKVESLTAGLKNFDERCFRAEDCRANAQRFGPERFQKEFKEFIEARYNEFLGKNHEAKSDRGS